MSALFKQIFNTRITDPNLLDTIFVSEKNILHNQKKRMEN